METKKWYMSKTIWAGIIAVLFTVYNAFNAELGPLVGMTLPIIPDWIYGVLASLGLYGRATATTTITR